ncbi:MAG: hypothetical protein RL518_1327 [Pseudomonadota bacterium]
MSGREQYQQTARTIGGVSDAERVMPHEDLTQAAASLDGEAFNAKLRHVVSSVKQGFRSEGVIVDFKEVCEDKVRMLNDGDNLRLLMTPLAVDGAHGRAFFELFGAGTNGDNILRFCQQELNLGESEAKKLLTPRYGKGAGKDKDVLLPVPLEAASPWVQEFMEQNWGVPGANIALAIRHTYGKISVGVCLGFEPLQGDVGQPPKLEERGWGALSFGLVKCAEFFGPIVGLVRNGVELTQIFFCLPTAIRKDLWQVGREPDGCGALSLAHGLMSGFVALVGSAMALEKISEASLERWVQFNDLPLLSKYGVIVVACNIASLVYELGWDRYQSDKRAAARKASKQRGAS